MFDLNQSGVVCVQQRARGAGVFNGTRTGYAVLAYSAGVGAGTFRARTVGADGNNWKIQLLDTGRVQAKTEVKVQGRNVVVLLKRSAGAITALLSEVAAALAAFKGPVTTSFDAENQSVVSQGPSPVLFGVATDATATAVSLTALSGGYDPTYAGNILRFDPPSNQNAGLFFFEAPEPLEVLQVEGTATLTSVVVANVDDALNAISGESADVTASAGSSPIYLGTKQALLVSLAAAGTVRVWVRRASRRQ